MMEPIYFVISDIHGHYDEMIAALNQSGFDRNDSQHRLIVLGDLFDRGTQSKAVLEYLYQLSLESKTRMVIGNHDLFLIELLQEKYDKVHFNIHHNGFKTTLESLAEKTLPNDFSVSKISREIRQKYPFLLDWLESFAPFLEIGDYILVHGGVNDQAGDWHQNSLRELVWSSEMLQEPIKDKIVIAGHHRTATIRRPNQDYCQLAMREPEIFDIIFADGKILIDGFVEVSKKINVLIIEP